MTTAIIEDFARIAAELKRIEQEKVKEPTTPLPDVQPVHTFYGFSYEDYDPA
jgi:hypothetical protein